MVATLCLAAFDLPSRCASGVILRYIAPRVEPVSLFGAFARRPMFGLAAPHSDLIVGVGHGGPNEYRGQDSSLIWRAGEYDTKEVNGKVVKLVSCQAGEQLGMDLVDRGGARCFMGYSDDIVWLADPEFVTHPWDDEDAKLTLTPVVDGLNALLDGRTCKESFEVECTGFYDNAERTSEFPLMQEMLRFNYKSAILHGDPNATVARRPRIYLPMPPPPLVF